MDLSFNSAVDWDAFDEEAAFAAGFNEVGTLVVGLISVDGLEFESDCVDCVTE